MDHKIAANPSAHTRQREVRRKLGKLSATLALVAFACGGCALQSAHIDGIRSYRVHLKSLFDNSRDRGPSYLVGPANRLGPPDAVPNSNSTASSRALTSKLDLIVPSLP